MLSSGVMNGYLLQSKRLTIMRQIVLELELHRDAMYCIYLIPYKLPIAPAGSTFTADLCTKVVNSFLRCFLIWGPLSNGDIRVCVLQSGAA